MRAPPPQPLDALTVLAAAFERWRELWERRELIYTLARRDVAVLYKQSAIGVLWVATLLPPAFFYLRLLVKGR